MFTKPCFLKWKNRKQGVSISCKRLRSVRFPGPGLRSNIIKNFNAAIFELLGKAHIEILKIYQDHSLGFSPNGLLLESFDGVQYGAGTVKTVISINRSTGQLRKAETIQGGILSATLGEGTKTYQEQCTFPKKP
jgi:hypothetical protein